MKRAVVSIMVLLTACASGSSLSDDLVVPTTARVSELAVEIGILLDDEDAECAALRLTDDEAQQLTVEPPADEAVAAASEALVDCVGSELIAMSALTPQAGGARQTSLECAARELDDDFVVALVAGAMAGSDVPDAEVELAVVTAFSVCLGLDELLDRQ